MTLLGSQDTGLGNVDTAGQPPAGAGGAIVEMTSPDGSVTIANPTGPDVQLEVPAAQPPASAVSGLTFPLVAGVPTLTASDPVTFPGLESTAGLEVIAGNLIADAAVPTILHDTLEVDGISTFNGAVALNDGGTIEGEPIAAQILAATVNGASTPLSGISAAGLTTGALAFVASVGAYFWLQPSALTVDHITVEAASGLAGSQWLRINNTNLVWQARTAWWVDPQNIAASDENDGGSAGAPLKTYAELSRRLYAALLPGSATVHCISDAIAGDVAFFTCRSNAGRLTFSSTVIASGTPLYTGTVTSFTPQATGMAADDSELADTGIPVSYTASGLLANNLIFVRTNGTPAYFWGAKDLGTKTLRTSVPTNANGSAITNPTAGDTYSVFQLPQLPAINFFKNAFARGVAFTEVAMLISAGQQFDQWALCARVFHNVGGLVPTWNGYQNFNNCAWDYGATANQLADFTPGTAVSNPAMMWGMHRTTSGNGQVFQTYGSMILEAVTFQGCGWITTGGGFSLVQGRLSVYDTNGTWACLEADYWSTILFATNVVFGTAGVAGKGNTGLLLEALNWSNMAYIGAGNVPAAAGATTNPTPCRAGATSVSVANLPILKGLADVGIFPSDVAGQFAQQPTVIASGAGVLAVTNAPAGATAYARWLTFPDGLGGLFTIGSTT
jgi:hypothetical protein